MESCNLLDLSEAGGCGCKIPPNMLSKILKTTSSLPLPKKNPNVLLGFETSDDCAVYQFGNKTLLFSTDFFSSIVNSPYLFGKIAAANALSDIYATGGVPLIVNSLLAFPPDDVPIKYVEEMIRGSQEILAECGIQNVGGHTIKNPQPLYGFSVIGEAEPENIKRNNTPEENDLIILTKPIGIGVISNSLKLGVMDEASLSPNTLRLLTKVNKFGATLGRHGDVHSMTDITGFGLVGHLVEMIENSDFDADISISDIPFLNGVEEVVAHVVQKPSGTYNNISRYSKSVRYETELSLEEKLLIHDPQTNGGLLFTVPEHYFNDCLKSVLERGEEDFFVIGKVKQGDGKVRVGR